MIERNRDFDNFEVSCDTCSNATIVDTDDWDEMIKHIKGEGWRVSKDDDGDWCHDCPACAEEFVL
jgi:hypothetical protein